MAARPGPVKTGVKWRLLPDRAILVENNLKYPICFASCWDSQTDKIGDGLIRLKSFPSQRAVFTFRIPVSTDSELNLSRWCDAGRRRAMAAPKRSNQRGRAIERSHQLTH